MEIRAKAVKDLVLKMKSNYWKRAEQADTIHAEIKCSPYPVLVCGDFNDTPASYTYHRVRKDLVDGSVETLQRHRKSRAEDIWLTVSMIVGVVTNIRSASYTSSGGLIMFFIRNR